MGVYYKKYFKKVNVAIGSDWEMIGCETSHWEALRTEIPMVT